MGLGVALSGRQVLRVGGAPVQFYTMFLIPGTRSVWAISSAGILRYVN